MNQDLKTRIFIPGMLIWTILIHLVVFATLFFAFDLRLFGMAFGLAMLTAYSMGIFHHMQLTHLSFESHIWVTRIGALLGTLTWRGAFAAPLKYAAVHTVHHNHADTELDPHTPESGVFHAFMGWFWRQQKALYKWQEYHRYVPEKWKADPVLRFLDKYPDLLQVIFGGLLFLAGGWKFVLYGVFVKTWIVLWAANAVDVINHTVGYRNYDSKDKSTNSFLMATLHLGGAISWHNNHHAHRDYFSVYKHWWEFDVHRKFLQTLEFFGLVWNIRVLDDSATDERTSS